MNRTVTEVPSISYNKLWVMIEEKCVKAVYKKTQDRDTKKMYDTDEIVKKSIGPTELFKSLGLSSQTLHAMRNNHNISLSVIDKLCTYFNCQPCDIMETVNCNLPELPQLSVSFTTRPLVERKKTYYEMVSDGTLKDGVLDQSRIMADLNSEYRYEKKVNADLGLCIKDLSHYEIKGNLLILEYSTSDTFYHMEICNVTKSFSALKPNSQIILSED